MEKIPNPPYRTYLNKYKVMSVKELEAVQAELEAETHKALNIYYILKLSEDWMKCRNLKAELETLNSVLNQKRNEDVL
jgi:predicted Mrr-cat superfamily restriction endonuclease